MKRSKADIVEHIKGIVEEVSLGNVTAQKIRPTDALMTDLGLDSMDYASVLLMCEGWLNIKVKEHQVDWRALRTVEQLAAFLETQQG